MDISKKKYGKEQENSKTNHRVMITNITWIISILVLIIIALGSVILCKFIPKAETIKIFIEYAATLLSITLSIFAIAFTYTSNNSVQRQFDKIDTASDVIKTSSQSLQTSEKKLM